MATSGDFFIWLTSEKSIDRKTKPQIVTAYVGVCRALNELSVRVTVFDTDTVEEYLALLDGIDSRKDSLRHILGDLYAVFWKYRFLYAKYLNGEFPDSQWEEEMVQDEVQPDIPLPEDNAQIVKGVVVRDNSLPEKDDQAERKVFSVLKAAYDYKTKSVLPDYLKTRRAEQHDERASGLAFYDVVGNNYVCIIEGNDPAYYKFPFYYSKDDGLFQQQTNAVYPQEEVLTPFLSFVPKSGLRHPVIGRAIQDTTRLVHHKLYGSICLMPDAVDDFNRIIRSQMSAVSGTFQLPRSIACMLALQGKGRIQNVPGVNYAVIDVDGAEFCCKYISTKRKTGFNKVVFVRGSVVHVESSEGLCYRGISDAYIAKYEEKYNASFLKITKKNMLALRVIEQLLNTEQDQYVFNGKTIAKIAYDHDIAEEVLGKFKDHLMNCVRTLQKEYKIADVYILSSLCALEEIYNTFDYSFLYEGAHIVHERLLDNLPLWEEYLPKLALEVLKDGHFSKIELIKENMFKDVRSTLYKEEIIPVEDEFTLIPGKNEYLLPLDRQIMSEISQEKVACLRSPCFPLRESVRVKFEVHYKYGDEESYQLIAKPVGKAPFELVTNEWQDVKSLGSTYVTFNSYRTKQADEKTVLRTIEAFNEMNSKLKTLLSAIKKEQIPNDYLAITKNEITGIQDVGLFDGHEGTYNGERRRFCSMNSRYAYPQRRTFFTKESYETDYRVSRYVDMYATSKEFVYLLNVVCSNLEKNQYAKDYLGIVDKKEPDKQKAAVLKKLIRKNAERIITDFGFMYSADYPKHRYIQPFIEYLKTNPDLANYIKISRCAIDDSDELFTNISAGVMDTDSQEIRWAVRTISQNCSFMDTWWQSLYNTPQGPEATCKIRDALLGYVCEWKKNKALYLKNITSLRDYLECLLSMCCLNKDNPDFLNPSDLSVRNAIKAIKEIDDFVREKSGSFGRPFVCRLEAEGIDQKEAYSVNPLLFMLIQVLSGQEEIKLTGWSSNE